MGHFTEGLLSHPLHLRARRELKEGEEEKAKSKREQRKEAEGRAKGRAREGGRRGQRRESPAVVRYASSVAGPVPWNRRCCSVSKCEQLIARGGVFLFQQEGHHQNPTRGASVAQTSVTFLRRPALSVLISFSARASFFLTEASSSSESMADSLALRDILSTRS